MILGVDEKEEDALWNGKMEISDYLQQAGAIKDPELAIKIQNAVEKHNENKRKG